MSVVKNFEKNFYSFMTFQVQAPCVQTGFWRLETRLLLRVELSAALRPLAGVTQSCALIG